MILVGRTFGPCLALAVICRAWRCQFKLCWTTHGPIITFAIACGCRRNRPLVLAAFAQRIAYAFCRGIANDVFVLGSVARGCLRCALAVLANPRWLNFIFVGFTCGQMLTQSIESRSGCTDFVFILRANGSVCTFAVICGRRLTSLVLSL